jgi:hypothetical protein
MLGIHKKTAVKYAQAEHFPEARSDRGRKLAPSLPFLHTQGQVEGQINRLKLLKRQSYGRASFDLLRHRVLARSA